MRHDGHALAASDAEGVEAGGHRPGCVGDLPPRQLAPAVGGLVGFVDDADAVAVDVLGAVEEVEDVEGDVHHSTPRVAGRHRHCRLCGRPMVGHECASESGSGELSARPRPGGPGSRRERPRIGWCGWCCGSLGVPFVWLAGSVNGCWRRPAGGRRAGRRGRARGPRPAGPARRRDRRAPTGGGPRGVGVTGREPQDQVDCTPRLRAAALGKLVEGPGPDAGFVPGPRCGAGDRLGHPDREQTRVHAEHADAVAARLQGEVLGQLDDGGLRDRVARRERPAVGTGLAGDVDDPSPTGRSPSSGRTSWEHSTMPRTLTSIVVHHVVEVELPQRARSGPRTPALLTRRSIGPSSRRRSATAAARPAASVTSATAAAAFPPAASMRSTVSASSSAERATSATAAPAAAKASATTRPMPRPAPVTSATEPTSRPVSATERGRRQGREVVGCDGHGGSFGRRRCGYAPTLKDPGQLVVSSQCSIGAPWLGRARRLLSAPAAGATVRRVGRAPSWSRAARSSLRLVTPSLMYARCRWLLTVRTDRNRALAISLLRRPAAASRTISRSRWVSATDTAPVARPGVWAPSHC